MRVIRPRLDSATPDVDVETGRFTNYLGRQSQTAQYRIARQLAQVPDSTWRTLDDLDVADPTTKVARGVRTSGATFRRALSEVSDPAKAALLRLTDDVATLNRLMKAWEHGQISTRELSRVLVRYNDLGAADQRAFGQIVRAGGDEAVEGAAKVDDAGFQTVMRADVDAGARAKNFRHFAKLGHSKRSTFEQLLRDDDLAGSWIRSVGADGTDLKGTRVALRRADEIDDAHTILEFESAKQANTRYIREHGPGSDGPHRDGGIVMKYETGETQTLYRLWDEDNPDSDMEGEFMTTNHAVHEADSFAGLTDKLAAPAHLDYDRIARVDVPAGIELRYSTAGPNFGRAGGLAQMKLENRVPSNYWTPLDSLSEVDS